jgi:type IV pilus assembly protein PilA
MLQKLRGSNSKGFTLIELMIVIAIIGILAAIAIPNFIAYRNKAFCSAAESDANAIAGAIADYYAVPSRTGFPITVPGDLGLTLSGGAAPNVGVIGGSIDAIIITVTDTSGRCPAAYMAAAADWAGGVFTKNM